ncbi:hypothetical protein EWI07_07160 [Sporolactobacillus sp. THM7-4]|nr:hypothetical protein EWI07_07160 [Sporolactobacillus sp. THM7-4]
MIPLSLAILLWVAGLYLLFLSYRFNRKLRESGQRLLSHAEHEKGKDNSASIAMTIEGKILDNIPSYLIHMAMSAAGLLIIALGFVALAFYAHFH